MSEQQFEDHMNELFLRDNQKPVSLNLLSQLPRSRFKKAQSDCDVRNKAGKEKDTSEIECAICMVEFVEMDEILTLTCFHKFHASCIETWFRTQNWCPICRNKIE